jgi:2-dehydropantoate 2-reductase
MGSVYAALLADAGNEVWAVDLDRAHVDAIRAGGLRVEGASGDRTVRLAATADAGEVGEVDLVVIATKAFDVEAAARSALALLGEGTIVLSIQNGIGGPAAAAAVVGAERVVVGVAGGFGASVVGPGRVHHHGWELVRLGELDGPATSRVEELADLWRAAGFRVATYDDVARLVWEKLICNVAFSGPCGATALTIGRVMADTGAWEVAGRCADEALAVARATGVALEIEAARDHVRAFGEKIPGAKPSVLLDLEAGRRCEIDYINGAIVRLGAETGVPTPTNEVVTAIVKAREAG